MTVLKYCNSDLSPHLAQIKSSDNHHPRSTLDTKDTLSDFGGQSSESFLLSLQGFSPLMLNDEFGFAKWNAQ